MLPPLSAALVATLLLLIVMRLIFRDWLRAALATSVIAVLFFSYGHVRNALDAVVEGGVRQRYLLPVWGILLLAGMGLAWRLPWRAVRTTTTVLNVAAAFLVLINAVPIVGLQVNGIARPASAQDQVLASGTPASVARRPDIYYIIFDRYARADTLLEEYGFDNTPFVNELEGRGFYVAPESNANYFRTALSLVSSLNMEYLDLDALRAQADAPDDLKPVYAILTSGMAVQNHLKSLGYTYVHVGSRYQLTATNSAADITVRYSEESEFVSVLTETTLLSAAATFFPEQETERWYVGWKHILHQFDQLERLAASRGPQPKYVFAHFSMPHPPFIFDRDGNFVPEPQRQARGWNRGFVDMVSYANKRILALVDILQRGPEETHPVVIIQSDEGPYPTGMWTDTPEGRWDQATADELREKYGILNAYYLPGVENPQLYPTISPVNSFRVVFNHYFDAGLELLPDRSYAPFDADNSYEVFEITDTLQSESAASP